MLRSPVTFAILHTMMGIVMAAILMTGFFAKRGWFDYQRIVKQNGDLDEKIQVAQQEKRQLQQKNFSLQKDGHEQETAIRQILGYIKKDEIVIEFP